MKWEYKTMPMEDVSVAIAVEKSRDEAASKAWNALAGYKFWMFGYYAARWVTLNKLMPKESRQANPFSGLVKLARARDES